MESPSLNDLAALTEQQFHAALGPAFQITLREVIGESHFRGGFRLIFANASDQVQVSYGDLELEITANGREVFGPSVHAGFEGIMFSREHLKQFLPRIVASALAQYQPAG